MSSISSRGSFFGMFTSPSKTPSYPSISRSQSDLSSEGSDFSIENLSDRSQLQNPNNTAMPAHTSTPSVGAKAANESSPPHNDQASAPREMELIDMVNQLHNTISACGRSLNISLPRIAVIGPQNGGKSSVLEAFVGREFLPRGSGLVTRRPLICQLIPIHEGEVLKLTVVDLPGIVKNVVQGQNASTIEVVRSMILEQIEKPECIILAVCPANQDIAGSDALEIAKIVDPGRERTIGVLTKLDIMDAGTNALDVLENRQIPLQRGYVGVVNRSQMDIQNGRDMPYILAAEKRFFEEGCYSHLAHRMGSPYLQKMLQKTLRLHIKASLPNIRSELFLRLSQTQRDLEEFEKNVGADQMGSHYYLIRIVQKFIESITINLMGNSELVLTNRISAGTYINWQLYTEVKRNLDLHLVPDEREIAILIANIRGIRNSIAVPNEALDSLCRKLVSNYKEPVALSVRSIKYILEDAILDSATIMDEYPSLKDEVIYKIGLIIKKESDDTIERMTSHIDAEMFYVNLEHPDFDGSSCASLAPTAGTVRLWEDSQSAATGTSSGTKKAGASDIPQQDSRAEDLVTLMMQNEVMQKRVQYVSAIMVKYLEIVNKQITDYSIKYIAFFLVKKVLDFIRENLVTVLLETTDLENLMGDCEQDFRRRDEMVANCNYLQKALDTIQKF